MNKISYNFNVLWRYAILPLIIFYLLKIPIETLFSNFIVSPVLSKCSLPEWGYDISVVFLAISLIFIPGKNIVSGSNIPLKWKLLTCAGIIIYIFYRVEATTFQFTGLKLYNGIKLLDIIFAVPVIILIANALKKTKRGLNSFIPRKGFIVDEATEINQESDLGFRAKFIDEIAKRIYNTNTPNSSFSIGIVATWGTGKTTFIRTLSNKLCKDDFILIEYNAWKCTTSTQIIETFFDLLKEELAPYSFDLNRKVKKYSSDLLKLAETGGLNIIKNIADIFSKNETLEDQYSAINEEIKKIEKKFGKRIVIFIDDLDRLDKKEIYEVIRLIRNTANFSNMFFIVAYDRNYILNAIEEINSYQVHYFLEKIFQVEFTLPPISNNVIEIEIWNKLEPFLTDNDKQGYRKLKERGHRLLDYSNADLTTLFIHNLRDVVRFINSFRLSYEFLKDEVFFPDFYNLELIRFKHPDLFSMIYKVRDSIFTLDDEVKQSSEFKNTYSLKKELQSEISAIRLLIESNQTTLKLNNNDINVLCIAFGSIFPNSNNILWSTRKEIHNHHLTVLFPSMFDRYFALGIEGKLSQIKFSKIRQSPVNKFIVELDNLAKNDNLAYELIRRLEEINSFDNKDDFEKIIKGLFYLANQKNNNMDSQPLREYIGFNPALVTTLLGSEYNKKYYNNNQNDYKEFIIGILKTNTSECNYTNIFLNYLLHQGYYSINHIIDEDEISKILYSNFKNALNATDKFTKDIWRYFLHCKKRRETPQSNFSSTLTYEKNNKAIEILKEFILVNDLDNFINYTISLESPHSLMYKFNNVIPDLFGSVKEFIRLIEFKNRTSANIKEFLKLNETMVSNPNGVPRDFFEVIKPQW